ncbi:Uncharacterised protein [Enterobacter cloacae]|nr:Uncharacterised protein [Enterobacter cloacae]
MLTAGECHSFRRGEQQGFIQRLQALVKHLYLAVNVRLQRLRLLRRLLQLPELLQADVDFLQGGLHLQYFTRRLLLPVRGDKQPFCDANHAILIGSEFKPLATGFRLRIHQMPGIQLGFAVLRGKFDMLLAAPVFHPQLVVRGRAQHIAGVVVAGDVVRVFRIVQGVGDIRQVDVAVAVRDGHFGAVKKRGVPAVRPTAVRLRHPQPQIRESLLCLVPVEIQSDAVAPLFIQVRADVIFLPALDAGRQRAVYLRARCFRRAEAVTFRVGHPVDGHVQAGVAGGMVLHLRDDHALLQRTNHLALRLQHLARQQAGGVTLQMNTRRGVQLPLMVDTGIKGAGFGLRLRVSIVARLPVRLCVAVVLSGGHRVTAHAYRRVHRCPGGTVIVIPYADHARHHLIPGAHVPHRLLCPVIQPGRLAVRQAYVKPVVQLAVGKNINIQPARLVHFRAPENPHL